MIKETATLHEGMSKRSRMKTYFLDSLSGIHGAIYVEGRAEYHSDHSGIHKECIGFALFTQKQNHHVCG